MTIEELTTAIINDERNQEYKEKNIKPIFQVSEKARVLIIGQAPGANAEASAIPFDDKSGETLRAWLDIDKEIFYSEKIAILPMDFYYPGKGKSGDKPPRKFIAGAYHARFLALMPKIQLTILIGQYANKYYLGQHMRKNLTATVYHYQDYLPEYFPIVHPSPLNFRWQNKNPWFKESVVPALQKEVKKALGEV